MILSTIFRHIWTRCRVCWVSSYTPFKVFVCLHFVHLYWTAYKIWDKHETRGMTCNKEPRLGSNEGHIGYMVCSLTIRPLGRPPWWSLDWGGKVVNQENTNPNITSLSLKEEMSLLFIDGMHTLAACNISIVYAEALSPSPHNGNHTTVSICHYAQAEIKKNKQKKHWKHKCENNKELLCNQVCKQI